MLTLGCLLVCVCCLHVFQTWRCKFQTVQAASIPNLALQVPDNPSSEQHVHVMGVWRSVRVRVRSVRVVCRRATARRPQDMGSKAHSCEIRSLHNTDHVPGDDKPPKEVHIAWPDTAKVHAACTGVEVRAMYLLQCRSVGCPTWLDGDCVSLGVLPSTSECDPESFGITSVHLRWYVFRTDQGPDEKMASKYVDRDIDERIMVLKVHSWCHRHALHLMAKRQLLLLDSHCYFSRIAKLVNYWRSSDNSKKRAMLRA